MQSLYGLVDDVGVEGVFATPLLWLDWPKQYTAAHGRDWGGGFFTHKSIFVATNATEPTWLCPGGHVSASFPKWTLCVRQLEEIATAPGTS